MSNDKWADGSERAFKKIEEAMKGYTGLSIDLEIKDGEWSKYVNTAPGVTRHGQIIRVGNLPNATVNGKPGFQLLAVMDDGTQVIVETTWTLMRNAVRALEIRWPVEG